MYAFAFCVDERYLLPSLVALGSLADSLPSAARREAAVRVLSTDLSPQDVLTMAHFARRAGFSDFAVGWARPPRAAVMADSAYITPATYLRFAFTPDFLGRPYLVYVDADTLAVGDITAPLETIRAGEIGLVADEFNPAVGRGHALPGLVEDRPGLRGRPYYNAGMWWLFADTLTAVRTGVLAALQYGRRYIFHNDQDALNLWLLNGGSVRPVAGRYNAYELDRFHERGDWVRRYTNRRAEQPNTALLHFVGSAKPWLTTCPTTPGVRLYRQRMARTLRRLDQLGDHRITGTSLWRAA